MPGKNLRPVRRWACVVMSAILLTTPILGIADWDPPGPPPIEVILRVVAMSPREDPDDGVDGNAEFILAVSAVSGHGPYSGAFEKDDLNWDDRRVWSINSASVLHQECTPMSPVTVSASLAEIDNGAKEVAITALLSAAQFAAACAWGGPWAIAGAFYGGVLRIAIVALNGNDYYGSGEITLDETGSRLIECSGSDGTADVEIRIETRNVTDVGQCDTPQSTPPPGETPEQEETPEETIGKAYDPLHDIYWIPTWLAWEDGNPANLTLCRLGEIGDSLLSMIVGWAQTMAGALIEDAGSVDGIGNALHSYAHGKRMAETALASTDPEARDNHTEQALNHFEQAARYAADLCTHPPTHVGGGGPSTSPLPFEVVVTPSYYSTRAHRYTELFVSVFGTNGATQLDIAGLPEGVTADIERLSEVADVYRIGLTLGDVPTGAYALEISATADGDIETTQMTLVVD